VHEFVIAWLLHAVLGWVLPRGGFAGGSKAKFAVAAGRGRKPDLSVLWVEVDRLLTGEGA
jgi:hypothetical protein